VISRRAATSSYFRVSSGSNADRVRAYARNHEAASIRRCWSSWNVLCTFLYMGEQGRQPHAARRAAKLAKPLHEAIPRTAAQALLETVALDRESRHQAD
jgi:integrase/recombinase XerC